MLEPDDLVCQFVRWILRENPLEGWDGALRVVTEEVSIGVHRDSRVVYGVGEFSCEVGPVVGDEDVTVLPSVSEQTVVVCRFSEQSFASMTSCLPGRSVMTNTLGTCSSITNDDGTISWLAPAATATARRETPRSVPRPV